MRVNVSSELSSYDILIENGIINNIGMILKRDLGDKLNGVKKFFIFTDGVVDYLYVDVVLDSIKSLGFDVGKYVFNKNNLNSNEELKNISTVMSMYSSLAEFGMTRSDIIISLGGGVVGDMSGFVASTFLRGIRYIQIPTTLLSQVDSSVGGKTGFDIEAGKNLVGSFYNPLMVIIDPEVLSTLDMREMSSGMAEVIKYAFIKDRELIKDIKNLGHCMKAIELSQDYESSRSDEKYSLLLRIIYKCCCIKKDIVEADQFDKGERMILNFGHTIGHALEARYGYKKYLHGEAVAIGMYTITKKIADESFVFNDMCVLSEDNIVGNKALDFCSMRANNSINEVLSEMKVLFGLFDLQYTYDCSDDELIPFIKMDKKNLGKKLRVVVVKSIGEAEIIEVDVN